MSGKCFNVNRFKTVILDFKADETRDTNNVELQRKELPEHL